MDIEYKNVKANGYFDINIDPMAQGVIGNRLLANIFEMTFLTNINDSLMSFGYGGGGTSYVKISYDPNDLQSIAAAMKVACDTTVMMMKSDQDAYPSIPVNERILSASVVSVDKVVDTTYVTLSITPEESDQNPDPNALILTLPL